MDETIWVLAAGTLGVLVPVGLTIHSAGLFRSKNAASAIIRGMLMLSSAALGFWLLGSAILQGGGNAVFAFDTRRLLDLANLGDERTFAYLLMALVATAPLSAMGERARTTALWAGALLIAMIVVPITGYWTWCENGWLRRLGFVDIAGASIVHLAGGVCAAVGCVMLGPRIGKYNRDGSCNLIPGHSIALAGSGLLLASVGWVGYVLAATALHGGDLRRAALNVILAASAGVLTTTLFTRMRFGKSDVLLTFSGLLGALVAITGAGGMVSTLWAVVIGAIAGVFVPVVTTTLDVKWRVDDPAGAIGAHAGGGLLGIIVAGMALPGDLVERLRQMGNQLIGAASIALLAGALSLALFAILRATVGLRLREADEFDGVDLAEHDLNAYPDFQQTMIKSYHLRET